MGLTLKQIQKIYETMGGKNMSQKEFSDLVARVECDIESDSESRKEFDALCARDERRASKSSGQAADSGDSGKSDKPTITDLGGGRQMVTLPSGWQYTERTSDGEVDGWGNPVSSSDLGDSGKLSDSGNTWGK